MSFTNSLGSHHGESLNSRADKMSGIISQHKKLWKDRRSYTYSKHFYNRKRRMFLKNPEFFDKI